MLEDTNMDDKEKKMHMHFKGNPLLDYTANALAIWDKCILKKQNIKIFQLTSF